MKSSFIATYPELNLLQNLSFIASNEAKTIFSLLENETFDIQNPTEEDLKMLEMLANLAKIILNYNFAPYILAACENIKNRLTEEKLFELSDRMFDDLFANENKLNEIIETAKKDILNGNTHEMSILCTQK